MLCSLHFVTRINIRKALEALSEMKGLGLRPNRITFLILNCGRMIWKQLKCSFLKPKRMVHPLLSSCVDP
ncbi:hypothetical protein P8452_37738 [Trifolium repens]|nr:hypothetical protein P8452_37738 [Trifolium repens]